MNDLAVISDEIDGTSDEFSKVREEINITIADLEALRNISANSFDFSRLSITRIELSRTEEMFEKLNNTVIDFCDMQNEVANVSWDIPNTLVDPGYEQMSLPAIVQEGEAEAGDEMPSASGGGETSSSLEGLGAASLGILKSAVEISDQYTMLTSSLEGALKAGEDIKNIQDMIFSSAQNTRSSYYDVMDTVTQIASSSSDAFNSTAEAVAFTDQLNKSLKLAGASGDAAAGIISQVTGALERGSLSGEEFRAIMDTTPGIIENISDYMGVPAEKLEEMANNGQITADVIKNSMFSAAEDTDRSFSELPVTWGEIFTSAVSAITKVSEPLLGFINLLANNLNIIGPIILGVAAAVAVYTAATKGATVAKEALNTVEKISNAIMDASPLTLIIMGIILLISLIYAIVGVINNVTGSSISALGVIGGAIAAVIAVVLNILIAIFNGVMQIVWTLFVEPFISIWEFILNAMNGGFNGVGGMVANLIGQIISWFLSLGQVVTTIIDAIFGTDWTSGLEGLKNDVRQWGKNQDAITLEIEKPDFLDRVEYGSMIDGGTAIGEGVENKIGDIFSGKGFEMPVIDPNAAAASEAAADTAVSTAATANNTGQIAEQNSQLTDENKYLLRNAIY